jgi:putative glutamine amidotransferase
MSRRPKIAVTGSANHGRIMIWLNMFAVWRSGGRPVRLRPGDPIPEDIDGAIIGGGDDIDASLYDGSPEPGVSPVVGASIRIDPERDSLELAVLAHCDERSLPVMGICRGAQMINVRGGGSLVDDIYRANADLPEIRTILPRKKVKIEPDSQLEEILGSDTAMVNALHHQAVDDLGDDIEVNPVDGHEVVQGIEATDQRLMIGVQWHPEFLIFDRAQQRLFRTLVKHARKAAAPA